MIFKTSHMYSETKFENDENKMQYVYYIILLY